MPSCGFIKCKNTTKNTNKSSGITFHALPVDELTKLKWISVLRKQRREYDWMPSQYTKVCSAHFRPDQIHTSSKGYKRIKKTAVPFYRIKSGPSKVKIVKSEDLERSITNSAGAVSSSIVKEKLDTDDCDDPLQIPRCASPSGLSDIGSSDLEDAFDTPTVLVLKKQLRENEEICASLKNKLREKEDICKDHVKKIKVLQNANKRLSEKNVNLKHVLTKLKRKLLKRNRDTDSIDDSEDEVPKPSQDQDS